MKRDDVTISGAGIVGAPALHAPTGRAAAEPVPSTHGAP
jgi:hypothetical protein